MKAKQFDLDILREALPNMTDEQINNYFSYCKFRKIMLKHYKIIEQYDKSKKLAFEYLDKIKPLETDFNLVNEGIDNNASEILKKYKDKYMEVINELEKEIKEVGYAKKLGEEESA